MCTAQAGKGELHNAHFFSFFTTADLGICREGFISRYVALIRRERRVKGLLSNLRSAPPTPPLFALKLSFRHISHDDEEAEIFLPLGNCTRIFLLILLLFPLLLDENRVGIHFHARGTESDLACFSFFFIFNSIRSFLIL